MKYINENSNRGLVNLFSDYIVNQINKDKQYDTVIEITDCGKFFVVNGMTNSDKILDMIILRGIDILKNTDKYIKSMPTDTSSYDDLYDFFKKLNTFYFSSAL